MSKSYAYMYKTSNLKYSLRESFNKNKLLILSLIIIALVGLLTGIFVAFKCGISIATMSDYNINIYICNESGCFADFCSRFFSCFCNLLILSIVSLSVFMLPIGYVVIAYRAYLVGFNCALLFCLYGISGALNSILIVLPCQILITFAFVIFFVILINRTIQKKKYGFCKIGFLKTILCFLLLTAILCLLETIIMMLFSATTILVI